MDDRSHSRDELAAVAAELARHLRWARREGVETLPIVEAAPLAPALEAPRVPPDLDGIRADLGDCRRCGLCEGRTRIVFGDGAPSAELVFVGDRPGADEDERGLPAVGPAGELLEKMIGAMGFARHEVYLTDTVKCRPPGDRAPTPDEVATCRPYLRGQLAAIRPKAIVALGQAASQALLGGDAPISNLRGQWQELEGVPVMPTFHPAYLLRNPGEKAKVWNDLKLVLAALGRDVPERAR
ncbi:uracil-DNA glycosylase [Vulgatibacter incomptus]|uniref:Type-4 uracil-DNA glycosylase n=1 Tax=Vulgatibacter incomptus TaxID=1391653 RepID=A0A0K1PDR3_9BACT|nr:uracil-DNA glycosylase [Vulgatibacter incomptus]AKU91660.1 Uracil-DNA glycosylase, family 4 [Vulgatibacter incomptus]